MTVTPARRRRWFVVALVALVAAGWVSSPAVMAEPPDIAEISRSVAVVETPTGRGAGFLIEDRLVVTAEHVVASGSARLVFGSISVEGRVIASDRTVDLSLVQLDEAVDLEPLLLADDTPRIGQEVYAIGAPTDGDLTTTRGIISAVFDGGGVQTDASVNPGNSGGPLIRSSDGAVIGVVTRKADAEGIGYATGAAAVAALVEDRGADAAAPGVDDPRTGGDGSGTDRRSADDRPGSEPGRVPDGRGEAADSSGSGSPWLLSGIAGGLLVVALVTLVFLSRPGRRKDDFEVSVGPASFAADPRDRGSRPRTPSQQGGS